MNIALDTNRYTDFARGVPEAIDRVREAQTIVMPFVTLAELRGGFLCGNRPDENEQLLVRFLSSRRVRVVNADEQTTHHYARIFKQLRDQGTPIPVNDMWTAAIAIQHGLILYARDRHFGHLPQIPRL